MNSQKFSKLFPFGSHLCREPMPPMSELIADMEILKKAGFNLIKLQEHWAYDEPKEEQYDFSKNEELIDYANKLDMGVYVGLTCEQAPNWLYEKYPDCRLVGRNGVPVAYEAQMTLPSDGKPGPCFDNPKVLEKQERFLKKLVKVLGAYENIVVWNIYQEITTNMWSEGLAGGQSVCYCPHTLGSFRNWLKERYGNLDGLNRAWKCNYSVWKYVAPDRANQQHLLPHNLDWNYFMENVTIARSLENRYKIIKNTDPFKRPIFAHHGMPRVASGTSWTYAGELDFLGSSCYPAAPPDWELVSQFDDLKKENPLTKQSALLGEVANSIALRFDYIRSCNEFQKPVWAAEFQGGPTSNGFTKGRTPSPCDIRRWILTSLAHGLTGLAFWVTRAEIAGAEGNGFSLLDSVGESSPRFEEASRIADALNEHAALFNSSLSSKQSEIAILINETNFQLCHLLPKAGDHLRFSTRGWHRMLWESGYKIDFIDIDRADEETLCKYKTLIMPLPLSLGDELEKNLMTYVKNGGNLISEACSGKFDRNGFCVRGELSPIMQELFGVAHKNIVTVNEPDAESRWTPKERTWGGSIAPTFLEGCGKLLDNKIRANVYVEIFELDRSQPLLTCGTDIAGAVNSFGNGNAWLLGTIVGHNGNAYKDESTWEAVLSIVKQCGCISQKLGQLLLSKRASSNKEAWFFFNPTKEHVVERIKLEGWTKITDLFKEKIEDKNGFLTIEVESLDVRVLILEK